MANHSDAFSIREYAANMRDTDFRKCWPFDGDGKDRELPPIEIRRFRLWSDDAEVPRRPETAPRRVKQKAPKKRSIVELFAAAPQVEEKETIKEMVRRKKKKKKQLRVEVVAGKKGNLPFKGKARRSALSSSVSLSHILKDMVHKKWLKKCSINRVNVQKKKMIAVKGREKKGEVKPKVTAKLNSMNRRELPVHGILKNHASRTSEKVNTSIDTHGGDRNLCCESEKRVSFSIKDVILGHQKSCSPMELSQLQSLCKLVSDVLAESSGIRNSCEFPATVEGSQVVTTNHKDLKSCVVEVADGSLSCSHAQVAPPEPIIPNDGNCTNMTDTQKAFLTENLDLNATQSDSDVICVNHVASSLKYSDDPNAMSLVCSNVMNPDAEKHGNNSFPRTTGSSILIGPSIKRVSGSDTVSSVTMTSTTRSKHPASCLFSNMEANGKQIQSSMGPQMDFFGHVPEFQPSNNLTPKDLISSICSSVGSKRSGESSLASDPGSTSKVVNDFIGLPLNSRGELIKLHSGVKFNLNGLCRKQNTELGHGHQFNELSNTSVDHIKMKGKLCATPMYPNDQSNWCPDKYYPTSKSVGFAELQGFERTKTQNHGFVNDRDHCIHHTDGPMIPSCHGCRECVQIRNCNDIGKFHAGGMLNHEFQAVAQPTMRLMGQNVTVGKSDFQCRGFDDARPWNARDGISENCFPARVSTTPQEQWRQYEWVEPLTSRSPKESQFQTLEPQPSMHRKSQLLPKSSYGPQKQWVTADGNSWANDRSSNVNLFRYQQPTQVLSQGRHQQPTQVLLNGTSKSVFETVSETEPVNMRHHLPVMASHAPSSCQNMLLNSTHCKHTQSISYSSSSVSNTPFPALNTSSSSLTQWLLNASNQRRTQQQYGLPHSRSVQMNTHHAVLGTDLIHMPSQYNASMVPFPSNNQTSSSFTKDSLRPPEISADRFVSAVNNTCPDNSRNLKRPMSKVTHPIHADQLRKRPAAKDDESMKPPKRPMRVHDTSNAPPCHKRREELHGYTWHNIVTPEYHVSGNAKVDGRNPEVTKEMDGLGTASGSCFSKPGPIKLSAGAKHILKPSLDMNHDCPRPVHSTLPFSSGASFDKVPASHKKATQIYRF